MTVQVLLYDDVNSSSEAYTIVKVENVKEEEFEYGTFRDIIQTHLDVCKAYVVEQGNEEWQVQDVIEAFNFHMESTDNEWRLVYGDVFIECYL